jgi:predicted glycoside hydrolase/deacetylase ChbG (UPF0249 family)
LRRTGEVGRERWADTVEVIEEGPDVWERILIVNADDWGLTRKISAGILRAHRDGIVTSTSVLAVGPAYPRVWRWLHHAPRLGVGVHLAAVGEDPPLLSAAEIPTLVDRRGRFPRSWRTFVRRAALGRVDHADLAAEFTAQLDLVRQSGVQLTHLDAHQHLHLLPAVADVVVGLACRYGIPAVRVPRLRALRPAAAGVAVLGARLVNRADRAGLAFPSDANGIETAGTLDLGRLEKVLRRLAQRGHPTVELTVHPGAADDEARARYRWGYCWEAELDALTAPAARHAVARHGFTLGTYADLSRPTGWQPA